MTNEQRTARERIEAVVMALIASASAEVHKLKTANYTDDVRDAAFAIATDAANAQVEILAIIHDLNHGAKPL